MPILSAGMLSEAEVTALPQAGRIAYVASQPGAVQGPCLGLASALAVLALLFALTIFLYVGAEVSIGSFI